MYLRETGTGFFQGMVPFWQAPEDLSDLKHWSNQHKAEGLRSSATQKILVALSPPQGTVDSHERDRVPQLSNSGGA